MKKNCGVWISILSHKLKKRMNAKMQSLGITGVQSHIMHFIIVNAAERQVFQRDVESAFCLSRSTATGILQSMEKNGLILRESVPIDARLKNLIPTEKAVSLDAQIGEYIRDVEQCITHGLTDAQLSMFFETAALMSDNLDA